MHNQVRNAFSLAVAVTPHRIPYYLLLWPHVEPRKTPIDRCALSTVRQANHTPSLLGNP